MPQTEPLSVPCPRCEARAGSDCVLKTDSSTPREKLHPDRATEADRRVVLQAATGADDFKSALASGSARSLAAQTRLPYSWVLKRAKEYGVSHRRFPRVRTRIDAERLLPGIGSDPDAAVAAVAGIHPESVGRIRRRFGIPRTQLQPDGPSGEPPSASPDSKYLLLRRYPGPIARFLRDNGPATTLEVRDALGAKRSAYVKKPLNTMAGRGWVAFEDGRWYLTGTLTDQNWEDIKNGMSAYE